MSASTLRTKFAMTVVNQRAWQRYEHFSKLKSKLHQIENQIDFEFGPEPVEQPPVDMDAKQAFEACIFAAFKTLKTGSCVWVRVSPTIFKQRWLDNVTYDEASEQFRISLKINHFDIVWLEKQKSIHGVRILPVILEDLTEANTLTLYKEVYECHSPDVTFAQ